MNLINKFTNHHLHKYTYLKIYYIICISLHDHNSLNSQTSWTLNWIIWFSSELIEFEKSNFRSNLKNDRSIVHGYFVIVANARNARTRVESIEVKPGCTEKGQIRGARHTPAFTMT